MKFDLKLAAFCLMFAVSAIASLVLLSNLVQEAQNIAVSLAVAAGSTERAFKRFRRLRNFPVYLQEKQALEQFVSNSTPLSEVLSKLMPPLRVVADSKGFSFKPGKVRVVQIEGKEILCRFEARDDAIQKVEFS
jgi:hypothetical protein